MTTPTSQATPAQPVIDHEAQWFAVQWLRGSRHLAVRTAPVIAVVQELATVLRDEQVPAPQALLALRRAVRLLGALTAGTRDDDRRESDHLDEQHRVPDPDEVTGSTGSVRLAAEWLRGDPAAAIPPRRSGPNRSSPSSRTCCTACSTSTPGRRRSTRPCTAPPGCSTSSPEKTTPQPPSTRPGNHPAGPTST
jgi:hypothetical protein